MSKKALRSGLEGWIRDTRNAAASLESDRDAGRVDLERLRRAARDGSDADLDELAGQVAGELAELGQAVEILRSASPRLSPARRRQLDLEPAPAPPRRDEPARPETATRRESSFAAEVLESDVPVLVNLVVEGHPPCRDAGAILESAREIYGGEVKVCAFDLLETDDEALPQMLKIGKGFLVKNLPAVLVYWQGRKVGEVSGDLDAESLAELIRAETGPPRGA